MSLTKVVIQPNDGLPPFICSCCLHRANKCYRFKQQCERSERKLRKLYQLGSKHIKSDQNIDDSPVSDEPSISEDCFEQKIHRENTIVCEKEYTNNCIKEINKVKEGNIDVQTTLNDSEEECKIKYKLKDMIDNDSKSTQFKNTKKPDSNRRKTRNSKWQCVTCGKIVSSGFCLKQHMRTHSGERPFSCEYCDKKFSQAQGLRVHRRVHTGEQPLECSICGRRFSQAASLTAHSRLHSGETPYSCTMCPLAFRTLGHLQYHIRQHKGEKKYQCDTCKRAFITSGDLKQHIRTHTGEKPHVCCVCGVRVARSSNLARHMRMHSGLRPFQCTACPAAYVQKVHLDRHMKKHLGIDDEVTQHFKTSVS